MAAIGRPRAITSPDEFDRLVDGYVELCRSSDPPQPITLTGLILSLGLGSREALDNYKNYPEFLDSVKRAKMLIEHEYEKRLVTSSNAAASIFALKNFGWSDKQVIAGDPEAPLQIGLVERHVIDANSKD